ncbi:hypothetical protein [Streptomyces sp. NBC_00057]|uniref:hypothetical protein n=1 Tax=Streptomyces sp. NBC_00057 TaxID=2975634 RepID=UPI0032469AAC
MQHVRREAVLAFCALLLIPLAVYLPADRGDAVDATQFTVAFFATLLTGEAVIFALTFSAASSWPSLRAIDSHIAFREWVFIGWVAAMFTACGLLSKSATSLTYGALLFILANVFGVFSFIRLFGLASIGGRNRLLRQTLTEALPGPRPQVLLDDPVVAAYLGALDQAISTNDPTGIRNLVGQLVDAEVEPRSHDSSVVLRLEVLHRLARATLVRGADPVVVVGCAESLINSVLRQIHDLDDPAVVLSELSRYLGWLGNTARLMSVRGIASGRAARELVAMTVDSRLRILLAVDPDPKLFQSPDEVGSVIADPAGVLIWARDFTEFQGAHQANALYSVFQILTGTKFMGNYWDGDSILGEMRRRLFGSEMLAAGADADAARLLFGTVNEFDRFWALVSVGAIATLRDTRVPHPPELVRPEFTPDPQLLGAYLRSFGTHRWFETAREAHAELLALVSRADGSDAPWELIRERTAQRAFRTPAPRAEPRERPAAMVLAIACRLAPLEPDGSDAELRAFLAALPTPALAAADELAARVLPGATEQREPGDAVVKGFRVMQLVGSHTRVGHGQ